jgi:hypothetical protein
MPLTLNARVPQVAPVQIPANNMGDIQAKQLTLESLMQQMAGQKQQQELGAVQLAEARRQAVAQQKMRELFARAPKDANGNIDFKAVMGDAFAIDPKAGQAIHDHLIESALKQAQIDKDRATTEKDRGEVTAKARQLAANRVAAILNTPEEKRSPLMWAAARPEYEKTFGVPLPDQMPGTDVLRAIALPGSDEKTQGEILNAIATAEQARIAAGDKHNADVTALSKAQADALEAQLKTGGQVLGGAQSQSQWDAGLGMLPEASRPLFSPMFSPVAAQQAGNLAKSPHERTTEEIAQKNAEMNVSEAELSLRAAKGDQVAAAALKRLDQSRLASRPQVTVNGGAAAAGELTPEDYKSLGVEYGITGIMPALGNGNGVVKLKITHAKEEWARQNGLTPRDLMLARASYAGDSKSLSSLQGQRDAVISFENTARKNLDMFVDLASKIPDTGVPWLNTPLRMLTDKMVGNENIAAVNVARQVANNEIAKVTTNPGLSGQLSDSARHEVDLYNPANATFKQTLRVAGILRQEMANRHQSLENMLGEIRGRIGAPAGTQNTPVVTPSSMPVKRWNQTTQRFE